MPDQIPTPPTSTVITVRGRNYRAHHYDWYIITALELAPRWWHYDDVIKLRNAIRENYQHQHNLPTAPRRGKARALRAFMHATLGS